jgi:hypothetical protein
VVPTTELLELALEPVVSVVLLVTPEVPTPVLDGVELLSLPQLTMIVEATRARPAMA